jgi:hypothetical protein
VSRVTCSWPVDRACLPTAEADLDIARQTHAEEIAVGVLWALSGRQFGVCPVIMRPCPVTRYTRRSYPYPYDSPPFWPVWGSGVWRNETCGCIGRCCDYTSPSIVHLSVTSALPIGEVLEVRIGDTVMDPDGYSVEGDLLYRADGAAWPQQDVSKPLPEDGTWSVTYTRGVPVPAGVGVLTGLLTQEFLKACAGGRCRLPRRVKSVSRQGVSYDMVDPTDIYATGKTGIPEIDLWLSTVNPSHLMAPAKVR